ncbi:MAG: hypothetical protein R3F07_15505 [Opitutaceae bacterium]
MKRVIIGGWAAIGLVILALPNPIQGKNKLEPGQAEVIYTVETPPAYGSAEGIAVDMKGNTIISRRALIGPPRVAVMNEIVRIAPDGEETVLADLGPSEPGANGVVGVVTDVFRNIYVAFDARGDGRHGVWKVGRDGGVEHLPGSAQISVPNALTFDHQGNLYVSDYWPDPVFATGLVWRLEPGGSFEIWAQSDLLAPDFDFDPNPVPLGGANGIVFGLPHQIYVANTEKSTIVEIQILPDGSAGEISVVAGAYPPAGPPGLLLAPDGLVIDSKGMLYAAIPVTGMAGFPLSPVIRINPGTGDIEPVVEPYLAPSPLFDFPTSLAFGRGKLDRKSLFVASMGAAAFGFPPGAGSRITQVGVGVPGKNGP